MSSQIIKLAPLVHKILGVEENTLSGPTVLFIQPSLQCFACLFLNASKELANHTSNLSVFRCPLPRKSFLHTLIIDGFWSVILSFLFHLKFPFGTIRCIHSLYDREFIFSRVQTRQERVQQLSIQMICLCYLPCPRFFHAIRLLNFTHLPWFLILHATVYR